MRTFPMLINNLSEMYGLSHEALQEKLGIDKEMFKTMFHKFADKRMTMNSSIVQRIKANFPKIGDDFFIATPEDDAEILQAREKAQAERAMAEQAEAQAAAAEDKKEDVAAPAEPAKEEKTAEKTEPVKVEPVKEEKPAENAKEEAKTEPAPAEAKEEPVKVEIKEEKKTEVKATAKTEAKKEAKAEKKPAAPAKEAEKKPSAPKSKKVKPFYKKSFEVVNALLEKEKCTLEQLADKLGMSLRALSNYTKGAIGNNRNFAMLRERVDATLNLPEEFYLADPAEAGQAPVKKKPAAKKETAKAEPKKTEKPAETTKAEPKKAEKTAEPVKAEAVKAEPAKTEPVKEEKPAEPVKAETPTKEEPKPEPVKEEAKAKPVKTEKASVPTKKEPEKKAPVQQAPAKAKPKGSSRNNKVKLKPAHVVIENILAMGYTKEELGKKIGKDERYIKRWLAGALSVNTAYDGLKEMINKAFNFPEEFYLPEDTPAVATEPAKEEKKEPEKAAAPAPAKAETKTGGKKPVAATVATRPLAKVASAIKKIDDNHGPVKFKGDVNEVTPEDVNDWANRYEEHLKERSESQYDKKISENIKAIDDASVPLEKAFKEFMATFASVVKDTKNAIRDNIPYKEKTNSKLSSVFDVLRESVGAVSQDTTSPAIPEAQKDEYVKAVEENQNEKFRKLVLLASKLDDKDLDRLLSVAENKNAKSTQVIDKALTLKGKELDTVLAVAGRGKMEDKFMQSIELTAKLNSDEKFDVILPVLKMTASK